MICPRCSVAEISPLTGACELCGFVAGQGTVAVENADATDELARRELAHEFTFDAVLGQGATSTVYLAREAGGANRHVVLKVLPREPGQSDADERFRAALAAVAALDHPHLVQLIRYGSTDSLFWYSTEHVRSRTLRDVLRAGPLDVRTCQRIAAQIVSALDHAHRRGVVHGSLKPENVLMDTEGWVRVRDLLVTRAVERRRAGRVADPAARDEHPAPPTLIKRPSFIAPEDFAAGQRLPVADQYALGALIYECLSGHAPADQPLPLKDLVPGLPAHVSHAVQRAMEPVPMARFPSVLDFVSALETGAVPLIDNRVSNRPSSMQLMTVPDWEPPTRPKRPRRTMAIVAACLALPALWFGIRMVRSALRNSESEYVQIVTPVLPPAPRPVATPPESANVRPESTSPLSRSQGDPRSSGRGSWRTDPTPQAPRRAWNGTPETSAPPAASAPATASAPPTASAPRRRSTPAATTPVPASGENGRLFVNATPWGQVYVDGQLVGNTPKASLPVAPGTHTLRVTREGYEPFERTFQVAPGEAVRFTSITLVERQP